MSVNSSFLEKKVAKRHKYSKKTEQILSEEKLAKPPQVVGRLEDGLVPLEFVLNSLIIRIPVWSSLEGGEIVNVFLDDFYSEPVATVVIPDETGYLIFPYQINIPEIYFSHKRYLVLYQIVTESGDKYHSEPTVIIIDRIPPVPSGPISLPAEMNNTITNEVIDEYPAGVPFIIPKYLGMAAGDSVSVALLSANGGTYLVPRHFISKEDVANGIIVIKVNKSIIEKCEEGLVTTTYSLYDRAGNMSAQAPYFTVMLALQPEAILNEPPDIPLADPVITDDDAREPVIVRIPKYINMMQNDFITLYWGGQIVYPNAVVVMPLPDKHYFIEIAVPRATIWRAWENNKKHAQVHFSVKRGNVIKLSPAKTVAIDLDTPGPIDPNKDTNQNESLLPMDVIGNRSGLTNRLRPEDVAQGAMAYVPAYLPRKAGEVISIYWGIAVSEGIASYTVTEEDVSDQRKTRFRIPIPSKVVDATPDSQAWPVRYELSNATNISISLSTLLDVQLTRPGGPDGLKEAEPLNLSKYGWMTEENGALPYATVHIDAYENMKMGDVITLHWVGYNAIEGVGQEIELTRYSKELQVQKDYLKQGVDVDIPFSPYIEGIGYGSVLIYYIVTQRGSSYASPETIVNVDLLGPDGW